MSPELRKALGAMRSVSGWFSANDAECLFQATIGVLSTPIEGDIVEIGSYCGRSTVILGQAAVAGEKGTKVFAVDPHEGLVSSPKGGLQAESATWETFILNIQSAELEDVVIPIRNRSADVEWSSRIAFLLIDGLHDLANVSMDYSKFAPHVSKGGCIAFHDYFNSDFPDVRRFVDGRIVAGEISIMSGADSPGRDSLIVTRKEG